MNRMMRIVVTGLLVVLLAVPAMAQPGGGRGKGTPGGGAAMSGSLQQKQERHQNQYRNQENRDASRASEIRTQSRIRDPQQHDSNTSASEPEVPTR